MIDSLYAQLADALDRLPGRFPRTPSGAEIPLLRRLFTAEQAELGAVMGRDYEEASAIAARISSPGQLVQQRLEGMEAAGLVLSRGDSGGRRTYRLAQFIDGIENLNVDRFDPELARLFEAYMNDGGARLLMGSPAYARVLPATDAIRSEWILPYDDVHAILEQTPFIALSDCFCRIERAHAGSPCRFPLHVCLDLRAERPEADAEVISTEQALAVLDEAERAGLVHTVSNVIGGWDWLCNCCSCCCEWLRGFTQWQIDTAVVRNYRAAIDETACTGCGLCEDRCQVGAIAVANEIASVWVDSCLGCGLCVTSCPEDALHLERLPEADIILPPSDHEDWEEQRLQQRADG
jgi:NAD-dependent dihydropyrimidine dehydrogenase PreA subunit